MAQLPRSGTDFLERFIQCLRKSVEQTGTSHEQLASALEELKLQELETCGKSYMLRIFSVDNLIRNASSAKSAIRQTFLSQQLLRML